MRQQSSLEPELGESNEDSPEVQQRRRERECAGVLRFAGENPHRRAESALANRRSRGAP